MSRRPDWQNLMERFRPVGSERSGVSSTTSMRLGLGTTYLGVATAILSALMMVWVLIDAADQPHRPPRLGECTDGTVLFMGSVQLVSLGIMGEYIRLIFLESKRRPAYIIDEYRVGSVQVEGHSAAVEGSETIDQEEILP